MFREETRKTSHKYYEKKRKEIEQKNDKLSEIEGRVRTLFVFNEMIII